MRIRQAGIIDLSRLSELFDQYRQFYRQPEDIKAANDFVKQRLQQKDSIFFIALTPQGEGAGFLQLYPSFSSVAMRNIWILNDLFVSELHRKSGVATKLIDAAKKFSQETNAMAIKLATAKSNEKAQALYNKIGFKKINEFDYYTLVVK